MCVFGPRQERCRLHACKTETDKYVRYLFTAKPHINIDIDLRKLMGIPASEPNETYYELCTRGLPPQTPVNQSHAGVAVGTMTGFAGFVCEQPCADPKAVSSTAASNAPPQFGSLEVASDQHRGLLQITSHCPSASHLLPPLALLKKEQMSWEKQSWVLHGTMSAVTKM